MPMPTSIGATFAKSRVIGPRLSWTSTRPSRSTLNSPLLTMAGVSPATNRVIWPRLSRTSTRPSRLTPRCRCLLNRGNVRQEQGDRAAAILDFDKAIEIKPEYADAYNCRGIALEAKGDLVGAIADFRRYLELVRPHLTDDKSKSGSPSLSSNSTSHDTTQEHILTDRPRLIEVAFPLKQTSLDSIHEKNVRHGHISTLHIWPARECEMM